MKRLIFILAIMALFAALPGAAVAGKPCPNPPCDKAPVEEPCLFDNSGVLENWDGSASVRCEWTVPAANRGAYTFEFDIKSDSTKTKVSSPYMAVTDLFPFGGDRCVYFWEGGWHELPYPDTEAGDEPWSFSLPADGNCIDDNDDYTVEKDGEAHEFALTVFAQKVRSGPVQLVWTNMPTGD